MHIQPQGPEAGKNKSSKKVPKLFFPKVQVSFSDFSKVPEKVWTKSWSSKVPKIVRKIVWKKRFFQTIFATFSGTFLELSNSGLWSELFLELWKNQKMELELWEKHVLELSSELLFFSIFGLL